MKQAKSDKVVEWDISDVERRVGQEVGGGQLVDPCSPTDIRRWVMATDYPNPIHWDDDFANASKFKGLVAPQSFAVAMDIGHGAQPACVGVIPGSHLLFGGDEWWHYGPRIRPGDKLTQKRRFHDFKVTDTGFAGPTMFARGDTLHINQDGTPICKGRSTAIRYLAAEAERRGQLKPPGAAPEWTRDQLLKVERERTEWIRSNREGRTPSFASVQLGDRLPKRAIGPHTIASFATEYRAFTFNVWGTLRWVAPEGVENPWVNQDPGWVDGFQFDYEGAKFDPRLRDGLYVGPSRGHTDVSKAKEIGMQRAYGYGATMGAWITDYAAYWAGHDGFVRHSNASYRGPAYEGDVTYLEGEVTERTEHSTWGAPLVQISIKMRNQEGAIMATATADVELPL